MNLRIAIPTDYSDNALKAARYAIDLFRQNQCTFFLVHTYTPAVYRAEYLLSSPGNLGLGDIYKQRELDRLEALKKELQEISGDADHRYFCHAAFNTLADEMEEMAEKEALDLIVMGTQGATGAREILFGSHSVQVVHKASCPVLLIPEQAKVAALQNILFPTDYSQDFSNLKLKVLFGILSGAGRKLFVLHTYDPADSENRRTEGKKQLQSLLEGLTFQISEEGQQPIIEAINQFAVRTPVQLLVMVRNTHTFLENLLVTPVIDVIGFHSKIPFMVLPPAQIALTERKRTEA
jgi:nucleotide-binding universal stress UspA family protein